jgi:DNA-binding PadR family transcriptional regulator
VGRINVQDHLPLSPAEFQVLVALADGEKHGYAIGKEVVRRTDGQVLLRAATLYTVIKRLLADGLIDESSARPDPALDDERRRYYRLSERGRKVAVAEAARLDETVRQARAKLRPRKGHVHI